MVLVKLEKIRIDCGTQSRCQLYEDKIDEYAEAMMDGAEFPAVMIFHDGNNHYLADGFHRYFANKKSGKKEIKAEVVNGTLTEAILYSKSANGLHGMPFTIEDKRKNVQEMLDHFEFGDWSDREIARRCCVSAPFVLKMRNGKKPEQIKYKGKDGQVKKMSGTKPKRQKKQPEPKVSENEEAQQALDYLAEENAKIKEQNERLQDDLAIMHLEGTKADKEKAKETIESLREEVRKLKIDLVAVKKSRDQYQNENAALKRQVAMLNKKLK